MLDTLNLRRFRENLESLCRHSKRPALHKAKKEVEGRPRWTLPSTGFRQVIPTETDTCRLLVDYAMLGSTFVRDRDLTTVEAKSTGVSFHIDLVTYEPNRAVGITKVDPLTVP